MSEKMHLVCLKETGHILAAFATATEGDEPDLAALVGDALPVANTRETVTDRRTSLVPADLLELKTVPYEAAVLGAPLSFAVDGGRVEKLPAGGTVVAATVDKSDVSLAGGALDRKVVAIVSADEDPRDQWRVQTGKVVDSDGDGNADDPLVIALSIMPGDTPAEIAGGNYLIMTAHEGSRIVWAQDGA